MARLVRVVVPLNESSGPFWRTLTEVRAGTMGQRGAGDANMMLIGRSPSSAAPYDGIFRSFAQWSLNSHIEATFDNGWDDIEAVMRSYIALFTRQKTDSGAYPKDQSYFDTGSQAQVEIRRLLASPGWTHNADGLIENISGSTLPSSAHWSATDHSDLGTADFGDERLKEYVNPNKDAETQVDANIVVGQWLPDTVLYYHPDFGPDLQDGGGATNLGVVLKTPSEAEGTGSMRAEFHSGNAVSKYRPKLVLFVRLKDPTPEKPRTIEPKETVDPDFFFRGTAIAPNLENPITGVDIKVRALSGGTKVWPPVSEGVTFYSFPRTVAWPDGEFRVANPRQPALPSGVDYEWACATYTAAGKTSAYSDWTGFRIDRDSVTVTPLPLGEVEELRSTRLRASLSIPGQAAFVGGYQIEVGPRLSDDHPLWRSPIWSYTGQPVDVEEDPEEDE